MPLIQYGQDLYGELGNNTSTAQATPFSNWQLTKFTFNSEKYYLFVEIDTGLVVVTQKIDKSEFDDVLIGLSHAWDYIVQDQRIDIANANLETEFTFAHNDLVNSEVTAKIQNYIEEGSQLKQKLTLYHDDELNYAEKLTVMSLILMTFSDPSNDVVEKIAEKANEVFPVKTQRPKSNTKYWDLRMQFEDPDHWKQYEYQDISDNAKISNEIKQNNEKLVDQYFKYAQVDYRRYLIDHKRQLLDFVNSYLLNNELRFVNSNLGDAAYYIWWGVNRVYQVDDKIPKKKKDLMVDQLLDMFSDFYLFLSRVGLIRQVDAKKIKQFCEEQHERYFYSELENDEYFGDDIDFEEFAHDIMDNPDKFRKIAQAKETPPEVVKIITDMLDLVDMMPKRSKFKNVPTENKERNSATYEIRTKLKDFRPSIWRRFIISGNSSVEILERAILYMFNVDWGHMYDLYNPETGVRYENQRNIDAMSEWGPRDSINSEKVKVSAFNEGEKLLLSYDYGDGWEFEVNIKKIDDTKEPPKYPYIISGKGLGIIDDIGGVWSLEDYYNTPEDEMDPELLDWIGGEKIDLDKFDKEELNEGLQHPPYWE